jgi:hypothetical protein
MRRPKTTPGQAGAVGTFYGMGAVQHCAGFNDAMWLSGFGEYLSLKDAAGKPYAQRPQPADQRGSAC